MILFVKESECRPSGFLSRSLTLLVKEKLLFPPLLQQEVQHGRLMLGGRGSFQEIYVEFLQSCVERCSQMTSQDLEAEGGAFSLPTKRGVRCWDSLFFFFSFFTWTYKAMLLRLPSCALMTGSRKNIKRGVTSSELLFIVWFRLLLSDTFDSGEEKKCECASESQ